MNIKFINELKIFLNKNDIELVDPDKFTTYPKVIIANTTFRFKERDDRLELTIVKSPTDNSYTIRIMPLSDNYYRSEFNSFEEEKLCPFIIKLKEWFIEESNEKIRIVTQNSNVFFHSNLFFLLPEDEKKRNLLYMPIEALDLSIRPYNCLKREGYINIESITQLTKPQLYAIHQLGIKSCEEIISKIHSYGFKLSDE